jgi:hypothetical protein
MAVAYFHEWPGTTREMGQEVADRVNARLGDAPPEGAIFHADGEAGGAWWGFDVWESEDAAQRFYDGILGPATDAAGIPRSQPRTLPVHWHSLEAPGAG